MGNLSQELFSDAGDAHKAVVVLVRLAIAMVLGGIIGFERQHFGKAAGARTCMLVTVGSALFTLGATLAQMTSADLSRIIQGIATGIGFVGAGTILKLTQQEQVRGLTTAASIWASAAVGVTAGAGWLWPALIGCVLIWFILFVLRYLEAWLEIKPAPIPDHQCTTEARPSHSP